MDPQIRITVRTPAGGWMLVQTIEQAAAEHGYTASAMRTKLTRRDVPLRVEPVAKLGRMPLYPAVALRKALDDRPGRGRRAR